jgi:hypothetical protein
MRWLLTVILVIGLALFGMACQGEKEEKGEATTTPVATATRAATTTPAATATPVATAAASPTAIAGAPDLAPGWTKIEPGGETICSRGTPFVYFVHPGTVNRLVVYFQGGGACWSDKTCSLGGIFKETADDRDNPAQAAEGILDLENPDNPFKDWFFVFIPYCTADIHWGNSTHTYTAGGQDLIIHHKGFVNFSAALDWIRANFEKPEKIFVSGCSAGSYGSIMGAPHIQKLYPDVPLYQLGDAGAGVTTDDFLQDSYPNWNTADSRPDWIPAPGGSWDAVSSLADLYTAVANYYPHDRWSQYNAAHDQIQTLMYSATGGADDWNKLMLASMQEIEDSAPNFHSYIAPGEIHCITSDDIFYTREVNGVGFRDWVEAMVNDKAWDDVMCADCETDPEG